MAVGNILLYVISYFGLFTATLFFISFFENKPRLKNPAFKKLPKVTIAVPAYNEEKTISATIRSLLNLDYPKNKLEIFVVDDGSQDNTYKIAKKFEKFGVKVFKKENTGKGDSLNFAIKQSTGEFFGALDADSFVAPDCLKKMIGYFNDKKVMAITPSLKIHKPKGLLQRIQSIEYMLGVYLRKVFAYFDSIHVTPGPFTIYRKEFFKKHGNYDANNLTEDIEIALRIQSKKYKIENCMDANVWTVGPNTFKRLLVQRRRWYLGFINNVQDYKRLFRKEHGDLGMFILPGSFVSVGLVIMLLFYMVYRMLSQGYSNILNLYSINFDIWPLLKLKFDTFFLNFEPIFWISVISFSTGLIVIYLAKKYSAEQNKIKVSYVIYLLLYWVLFAYWWIIAFYSKATKKKVVWGKKAL